MPAHGARLSLIADYPDGDTYAIALRPEYRAEQRRVLSFARIRQAVRKSKSIPDSPERDKLYREMARLMEAHTRGS
jgi:hypothetical protein